MTLTKMFNNKIAKVIVSASVGIIATFFVYSGLQDSINRPSLNRLPVPSDIAVDIVIKEENLTQTDPKDFSAQYVHIKGDGRIFESDPNSNTIGKYVRRAQEPTITTGNHFAGKLNIVMMIIRPIVVIQFIIMSIMQQAK